MAHTKAAGSTKLGRDSQPQYLGVKLFAGEPANIGSIIIRQRGTKFVAGKNVRRGSDDTLYSIVKGIVKFTNKKITNFTGALKMKKVVNVITAK
ncbi:MAG: Ribosomal protein L27 [Parcubacteria group bacterium GW2011_GWA2_43_9b]|uniref:Large ribosomal subunit protein bL27 n=1 Tax=Candidatus Portnoybacteria bacterium RIFCSPLOWO2_02_FULL_39_11 TaxID=1802001 RepID=A0A1G2FU18_9BACT|nr:MAG: Ribosomal protein L27 [Parcubacteria group bacterium GW2011_GWA2_43_9b]OGZ41110.1 MAG: 50S ribosomal protein L27 [Candidatus Portnoybacteria bacterium RIFCSPLOWO2_02_FULL_39_11]